MNVNDFEASLTTKGATIFLPSMTLFSNSTSFTLYTPEEFIRRWSYANGTTAIERVSESATAMTYYGYSTKDSLFYKTRVPTGTTAKRGVLGWILDKLSAISGTIFRKA